jgi:tRNA(Ile)-lysidine synthase
LLNAIQAGRIMELPGYLLVRCTKSFAIFETKQKRTGIVEVDVPSAGVYPFQAGHVTLSFSTGKPDQFQPTDEVAFLDADRAPFPLYIRNWKKGDFFRPLGMKGHKKLSDYLIDRKVPRQSRKRIPLVFKDDDLIWVAGHQIHHNYRVTPSTRKLLRIELRTDA